MLVTRPHSARSWRGWPSFDKTTITTLLRISGESVAKIVVDVVAEELGPERFDGLRRIGVDEVAYRKGHRYLTVVADHDQQGRAVWAGEGKNAATLKAFYDELGPERVVTLEAISLDMGAYEKATNVKAPHIAQCVDLPSHKAGQRGHRQGPTVVLERRAPPSCGAPSARSTTQR